MILMKLMVKLAEMKKLLTEVDVVEMVVMKVMIIMADPVHYAFDESIRNPHFRI